ncbi:MAG: 4-hydroxy-tetrahydrodipicolinate synthase, partial [Spirochaetales bacterium]|nr:4-hydroxy-tetrahydrodipicolinate synthase [Spirochaetales bacterium]
MYRGVYTALVTPFTRKGEVDEKALTNLVENQIASGVDGLVPIGTTGESPTLSHREVIGIVELVLKQTAGRIPVIVGTGSNDTKKAIELTREAESLGAQGSLQVTPYYNKPTQEGLYRHFSSIAEATSLPIILYNIPGRSGVPIALDTLKRLVSQAGIKAVKEASGDISGIMSSIAALGDKLDFLSGDDNLTLPIMALGGTGVISVLSNLFPKEVKKMVDLAS